MLLILFIGVNLWLSRNKSGEWGEMEYRERTPCGVSDFLQILDPGLLACLHFAIL